MSRAFQHPYITLPGLKPTIVTLLILSLVTFSSEFDRPMALGNSLVHSVSNVIATFVHTYGIAVCSFHWPAVDSSNQWSA